MRILINDGLSEGGINKLKNAGHEVVTENIPQNELAAKIGGFDALVVRSATKVRVGVIDGGIPRLSAVVRGGVGIDNIDHEYAESKGIKVMNTPSASSPSVAELALAHMFALSRHIVPANLTMRQGEWNKKQYKGVELAGKTLGVMGIGRIGLTLATKALALGMKVIAFDPYVKSVDIEATLSSKEKVLKDSDYISMHMPAQEGKAVLGTNEFPMTKKGVYIINCARGGVVDEVALLDALESGRVAGAGIDVFVDEPAPNEKLTNHPRVSVTPHIGASTVEAQDRIGIEVADRLIDFFENK